ncbi:MAG: hypothetical protein SGJ18_06060 [Pseudomonadota bacterium]|nr:hypothetical protein [Pseudomonadota bacterium]
MNKSTNNNRGLLILLLGLSTQFVTPASAIELTKDFNFEGYLLDSSDVPLASPASLVFQIYNPAGNCLVFEETQSSVPIAADGFFSTKVGSGSRASAGTDGGLLWRTLFQNDSQLRSSTTPNCAPGYTPAAFDGRLLRVTVNGTVLSPDLAMSAVPMATVSESLQGKVPTDFVPSAGNSIISGPLKFSNQNELRFGDSGSFYVGLRAPAGLGSNTLLTLPPNAGTVGQILATDGAGNLSWTIAGGGGTVTSISTGAGLVGGPITTTGSISVDVGTTAGKIVQLDGSAMLPAVNGSLLTNVAATSFSGILPLANGGTGASTIGSARTNLGLGAAALANVGFTAGDVLNANSFPICLAGQKIQVSGGPTYSFGCTVDNDVDATKLPLAGGSMTGNLQIGTLGTPTSPALQLNTGNTGLFVPGGGGIAISVAGIESLRVDSSGNVGIGTTSPTAKLDVATGFSMFSGLRLNGSDTNTIWQSTAAPLNIAANGGDLGLGQTGTPQMIIKPSGNVGIGTNTPGAMLDVVGSVKIGPSGSPLQYVKVMASATCGAYTPTLPIPANNGASCVITSVPGVAVGDTVLCHPTSNPTNAIGHSCYVNAASQVTVGIHNLGASGLSVAPTNWNVTIVKF